MIFKPIHSLAFAALVLAITATTLVAQQQPAVVHRYAASQVANSRPRKGQSAIASAEGMARIRAAYAKADELENEATALYSAGKYASAESACLGAIRAAPAGSPRPSVSALLGDIYLESGQNAKALAMYLGTSRSFWRPGINLNIALCYVRLGEFDEAHRYYADEAILQHDSTVTRADLPGTLSPKTFEASIRLARGLEFHLSGQKREALRELRIAENLAPANGYIPYLAGSALVHMGRYRESIAEFQKAAIHAHGPMATDAKARLGATATPPSGSSS